MPKGIQRRPQMHVAAVGAGRQVCTSNNFYKPMGRAEEGEMRRGRGVGKRVKMKGRRHESFLQTTELKGSLFTKIIYKNWRVGSITE